MSQRPNVLVVIVDEWRAQAFGYRGDPNASTPAIDGLAAESIDFRQAVAGHPICCPSRASMITGQHSLQHGVIINDVPLEPSGPTMGELFRDAGYRTGFVGKWHLYGSPGGESERRAAFIPRESRFGFEHWRVLECSHDYNHSGYYADDDPELRYWPGYDAFAQTDNVCAFIEDATRRQDPYLMVVSYGPPHFPHDSAPEPYRTRYEDAAIQLRPNVPDECAAEARAELRGYYAHGAAADSCVARLLETVERTGAAEDTVVVFLSDHGDMMGSQGFPPWVKFVPWEESARIPFLLRYPARFGRDGSVSDATVDTPDLLPMLLGLCGIGAPDSMTGTDHLNDSEAPESALLILPVSITASREFGIGEYRGVRTARHTYVRSRSGPWLLYDNVEDPYQLRNLVEDPGSRELLDELDRELRRWLERLDDPFDSGDDLLRRSGLDHFAEAQFFVGQIDSPWDDWASTMPAQPAGPRAEGIPGIREILAGLHADRGR